MSPRSEDGLALVLALAVLVFASASTATAIYMTTSTQTTSNGGAAAQDAMSLAQAGLNDAIATLNGQLDSDGAIILGGTDPRSAALFSTPTTVHYADGTATYSGTIDANYVWTISSTGSAAQQNNKNLVTRKLTQKINVLGINDGASGGSWSRFYQDNPSSSKCLTINNDQFVTNIGTRGCLKLTGGASIIQPAGGTTNVDVGTNITITGTQTSTTKFPTANVAGTGWTNPTRVYANDGSYATQSIAANSTGANLDVTGLSMGIPTDATINGIVATVDRQGGNCCNEEQKITYTGNKPLAGTFTLTTSRATTSSLNFSATAAQVQSALTTTAEYGTGNVTCTGGPLNSAGPIIPITCDWLGTYANQNIATMTSTKSSWTTGSSISISVNQDGTNSGSLQDATVQLLKAASPVGTGKASANIWGYSSASAPTYGSSSDLWGTTWTPAEIDASNFGLRLAVKNTAAVSAVTASADDVSIKVYYTPVPPGIGTSTAPVTKLNVGGTCQVNTNTAHSPCSSVDDTYASTTTITAAADNPVLSMPEVDFTYWYQNAKPGPKHFCTNPNPGITASFFDTNSTLDGSGKSNNGEIAPKGTGENPYITTAGGNNGIDYDCEVWSQGGTSGTLLGELKWNHSSHRLDIAGTIFIDGNYRFDDDGEIIHYFGRADIMSSVDDEIDALVCAGGTGNTYAMSCLGASGTSMATWDPTHNMMVLMSEDDDEYDQGDSSTCGGSPPNCYGGIVPSGFQGILYSHNSTDDSKCTIHQQFQDSGPVICDLISLPNEAGGDPTYYTFPTIGNLTDGQTYAGTANASNFEIQAGQLTG